MLMASFLPSAMTINFDGLSPLWLRNVTMYVLATAGGKWRKAEGKARGYGLSYKSSEKIFGKKLDSRV